MEETSTSWLQEDAAALEGLHAFKVEPSGDNTEEVALAWCVLDHMEKTAKKQKDLLKPHLTHEADQRGITNSKGGRVLAFPEGITVTNERRVSSTPNSEGVRTLLEAAGIPVLDVFDEVKSVAYNPSKAEYLEELGKIPKGKLDALKEVSWALKVTPSPKVKRALGKGE